MRNTMTLSAATLALAALVSALGLAGCADDPGTNRDCEGELCLEAVSKLELQPSESVIGFLDTAVNVGETITRTVRVINVGQAPMNLTDIQLVYSPPDGAAVEAVPAFTMAPLSTTLPLIIQPFGGIEFPQGMDVDVIFTRPTDTLARTCALTFTAAGSSNRTVSVELTTDVGTPRLQSAPGTVDFGLVPRDDTPYAQTLTLINSGTRSLNISGFRVVRDGRFGVRGPGFDLIGPDALAGVDLSTALEIPPGESTTIEVTYLSESPAPADGDLLIFSDDPISGQIGHEIPLVANKSGPCVQVAPRKVDFGGKIVGELASSEFTISSCGTEPLTISAIGLAAGSSTDFALDFSSLPEGWTGGLTPATPLLIPINESVTVTVNFVPDQVNPRDADNIAIPDEGVVEIVSNAFESLVPVELSGSGSDTGCPTPIIVVEQGEEVIPQTVLQLDATQSYAAAGPINIYSWTIDQPDGSASVMVPSYTVSRPVFEANVVGSYVFHLDVIDAFGNRSGVGDCPSAQYEVLVQPDQAIHVELTWVTPGDSDETDTGEGVGSDLDLHFAHQNAIAPDLDGDGAPDTWFDDEWDVFWFNKEPNWGSFDPNTNDNPSLDRDDTDGAGPENLNLSIPEGNTTYSIGVHYWNDWDFGDVNATVKVWHYADLIYEASQGLAQQDMWCVGKINWPVPAVHRCADPGDPEQVTPNYVNTFFQPPVF